MLKHLLLGRHLYLLGEYKGGEIEKRHTYFTPIVGTY